MKTFPRKLELLSKIEKIEDAAYFAEAAAKDMKFSDSDIDDIAIALTEAVSNAMMHGNKHDETKKVTIEICEKPDKMVITILDEGGGFDPINVADPLLPENLLKESGRGIFILNSLMDGVNFSSGLSGTLTTLIKNKNTKKN
jgi:serine/threonine-protein kinase RsbW